MGMLEYRTCNTVAEEVTQGAKHQVSKEESGHQQDAHAQECFS
jgi:hypothetical protein